jgi:hypothetical protein
MLSVYFKLLVRIGAQPVPHPPDLSRCSTAPGRIPPPLTSFVSQLGRPLCGEQCRAEMRWVRAELFNRRPQSGTDGEETADEGKCGGDPAARAGPESVHNTTLAPLAEQNRCQVGPTIHFDRPRAGTPAPRLIRFPVGPATALRRAQKHRSQSMYFSRLPTSFLRHDTTIC